MFSKYIKKLAASADATHQPQQSNGLKASRAISVDSFFKKEDKGAYQQNEFVFFTANAKAKADVSPNLKADYLNHDWINVMMKLTQL